MTDTRKAMQQALEALSDFARFQSMMMDGPDDSDRMLAEDYAEAGFKKMPAAIEALRKALAQQGEQQPVAWMYDGEPQFDGDNWYTDKEVTTSKEVAEWMSGTVKKPTPLYTAAPAPQTQPEWLSVKGPSGDTLADFKEGQWWLPELHDAVRNGTSDQKRAVAVVVNLLNTLEAAIAGAAPAAQPLTQTQVIEGFCSLPHDVQYVSVFEKGVRFAEAAHGIGVQK